MRALMFRNKRLGVLLGVIGLGTVLAGSSRQATADPELRFRVRTLNGTANANDEARALAVDSQNNVIAAGFTDNVGTDRDFTVAKFDTRGDKLMWVRTLNGTAANSDDAANSVAVDSQNNVIAAGFTDNTGTGLDFTVAKFDASGNLLWQRTLNGTVANASDIANSVAVDSQNNVIAAGFTQNTGTDFDFTVAKFDANGNLSSGWPQLLNGTAANSDDAANSVAVDSQNNVIAAGFTREYRHGLRFHGGEV